MIAKIISSLFICFVCLNANAQNVGIGTTTPANKLSVNGNADFTGKVGIGTSAPLAKLDVSGNVKITDGTQGAGKVLTSDANGLASWTTLSNSNWVLTGNAGTSAATHFLGTTDNCSLRFKTNNTQIMIIDSLGKVGIGTSSPLAKLDIAGNVKIADGTQGAGKVFTSDVNGVASWVTPASGWALTGNSGTTAATNFIGTTDNRSLRFRTNNTEKMIVDSLGNIGIGTASPAGLLHIKSLSSSLGTVDQQQTVYNETGGGITQWQSFTAGITGQLYRVDLLVSSPIGNWYEAGTIKIYSGEGNAGTLLSTTPVTFFPYHPTRFQEYTLSTLVNVTAGNKYTIEFTAQSFAYGWVESNSNNPYPGGITSFGSNVDFGFKTYVNPLVDAVIVSDGKVGIGSTNPSSKLEVIGTVRIADGTQGLGKVLTSNANGVASWVTPASGWALTGNSGTTAATNFIGTTDNRSLRLRTNNTEKMIVDSLGNVGIGMINPAIKLDLDTNQIIGTSRTFVTQHDFTNRGTKVSFGYSIPGNEFLGMKSIVKAGTFFCGNSGDIGFYTWECNTSSSREVMRINGTGNVGIGTTAPTATFSVNGSANNTTGSWGVFSDARIKTINSDFTDGLNVISKIHTVKFNYNDNAPFKAYGEQIGIVAQELEKIAPYMVSQKDYEEIKDLREVNNQAYVFLLINAVKELNVQNQQLKAELELVKNKLGLNTQAINH